MRKDNPGTTMPHYTSAAVLRRGSLIAMMTAVKMTVLGDVELSRIHHRATREKIQLWYHILISIVVFSSYRLSQQQDLRCLSVDDTYKKPVADATTLVRALADEVCLVGTKSWPTKQRSFAKFFFAASDQNVVFRGGKALFSFPHLFVWSQTFNFLPCCYSYQHYWITCT